MERSNAVQLSARANSLLFSTFQKAGHAMRIWRSNQRTAHVLAALSAHQLRDCGIEAAELDGPSFEVPKGLLHKLMSMR